MAYGHAERNLATLRLLQRQADLLEERARQRALSASEQADAPGDRARGERDSRTPHPAAPHRARRGA